MDKHLFLLGFMGAGKSYWGQKLALERGLPFYDLDQFIENQTGKTIPEIFESMGSHAFRQMEATQLRALEHLPPGIVAVGGGTPCFYDNMEWMNAQGLTVYIKVPVPVLLARLEKETAQRPVLAGKLGAELEQFVVQLLGERTVYYEQADLVLEVTEDFNTILIQYLNTKA
jgi:shikimate kinase